MKRIERFEDLEIWNEAIQLGAQLYRFSEVGKLKRDFSAKDQLKRAAVSVSNNIAEGFEYNNNNVFQRFLTYAKGSAGEIRSQLFLLKEAEMITSDEYKNFEPKLVKISSKIAAFKRYLRDFENKKTNK
jgi:four helix bundle protein